MKSCLKILPIISNILVMTCVVMASIDGICVINLDERSARTSPLLWSEGTQSFLWPERRVNEQRLIDLDEGEEVHVLCHAGSSEYPTQLLGFNTSLLVLKCNNDGHMYVKGDSDHKVDVESLGCSDYHEPWFIIEDDVVCALESVDDEPIDSSNLTLIKVGWRVGERFVEQYRVCQDTRRYITLWTEYRVEGKSIDMKDSMGSRPPFRRDVRGQKRTFVDFEENQQLEDCFTKKWQGQQVLKVLGHNTVEWSGQPVVDIDDSSATTFLSRGHLAPVASFVYRPMQAATFYLFNAAHQYQSFNGANWLRVEMANRAIATKRGHVMRIWTGTYGILGFEDVMDVHTELHMFTEMDKEFLPVAKYFWKLIYDPLDHEAVVIVGLNNPHVRPGAEPQHLCRTQCDQLQWASWDEEDIRKGLMHCCRLEELKEVIHYLPHLANDEQGWPELLIQKL